MVSGSRREPMREGCAKVEEKWQVEERQTVGGMKQPR